MSSGDLRKREIINNCYILRDRIGSDAFCEIWKASALFSATEFIVRFLREDIPQDLIEAERKLVVEAYDVRQAAILDVVEMDRVGSSMFISAENSGLSTLEHTQREGATFSLEHICGFMLELSRALDAFHRRGIVYGTLNAESVFVSMEGGIVSELKLVKPGYLPLLSALPPGDTAFALANHGFLAPECKGAAKYAVDARADIYSLGILLYRLVTGMMPFRGQSADRARDKAVSVRHVSNALTRRDVPPELTRIAVCCVRKNPRLRYDGIVGLIRDLKAFLDSRRIASIRSGVVDPLADLERLNAVKTNLAAEQVIRKLDMAVYFRALSEGPGLDPATIDALRFPIASPGFRGDGIAGAEELEELEELEEIESVDEDDDDMPAEDIVARSQALFNAASSKRGGVPAAGPAMAAATGAHGSSPGIAARPVDVAAGIEGSKPYSDRALDSVIMERTGAPTDTARAFGPEPDRAHALGIEGSRIVWRLERISADELSASLSAAFESSRKRKGAFRYIERPPAGEIGTAVFEVFSGMAGRATLVIIPAGDGSAGTFSAAFRAGLESANRAMTPGARRRFKIVAPQAIEALDRALSPPGMALDAERGEAFQLGEKPRFEEAAAAFSRLATRSRPVVIILESCGAVDARVLAYLDALALHAPSERLCVFAFFEGVPPVLPTIIPTIIPT